MSGKLGVVALALVVGCSGSGSDTPAPATSAPDAAVDAAREVGSDAPVGDASRDASLTDTSASDAGVEDASADDAAPDYAAIDALTSRPPPVVVPATPIAWTSRNAAGGLSGTSTGCRAVSFADIDDDGAPDLVFGDQGVVRVMRNDGNGVFSSWAVVSVPTLWAFKSRCPLAVGDFDGDGRRDIAVGLDSYASRTEAGVAVLFQDANAAFTVRTAQHDQPQLAGSLGPSDNLTVYALAALTRPGQPTTLFAAHDLDGAASHADATLCHLDARGVNLECPGPLMMPTSVAWTIDPATRDLTLSADAALSPLGNAMSAGATDFDGDGRDDLLVGMDYQPQAVMRATSTGFVDRSHSWGVDVYGHGMGVALGDLDDDGVTDAVVTTLGGFFDFRGVAGGGFVLASDSSPYMTRPRSIWPWSALLDDVDADGRLDLVVANDYASSTLDPVRFMQSLGGPSDYVGAWATIVLHDEDASWREFALHYESIAPNHGRAQTLAIADIDGDGHPELATLLLRAGNHDVADLYVGHLLGGNVVEGHGLTVRFGVALGPGTRAELDCGGRTYHRQLYAAEGFGNAARTEMHFGCGSATTFDELRVYRRGEATPIVVPGGALDTALRVVGP